jgi:thioredoxin-related protein
LTAQLPDAFKTAVRQWAWILACLPLWALAGPASAQTLALSGEALQVAHDLAADARVLRQRRIPLMVLYSRADCPWCERARRQYLVPLANEPASAERVLMRQIDLDSDAALVDFNGKATTHRRFGKSQRAKLTPTLMFYGPDGRQVGEPIVGFLLADFYAAHIDRGIDQGLAALRQGKE